MKTRTGAQIRSHAQKYYNKKNKHSNNLAKEASIEEVQEVVELPIKRRVEDSLSYDKMLNHIKVVESLQRVFNQLEYNPNDTLAHIELMQGEKLCETIAAEAKELLPTASKIPELHKLLTELIGKLNTVYELIFTLSPQLKEKNYFRYLADLL